MKIVRIYGGLGNQMFQFAFGEYLRRNYNTDVSYDISFFENQNDFMLSGNDARSFDLIRVYPKVNIYLISHKAIVSLEYSNTLIHRLLKKTNYILLEGRIRRYYTDTRREDKILLPGRGNEISYFEGYWQDLKFVLGVKDLLSKLFDVGHLNCNSDETSTMIQSTNSVSLHVRRGDYLNSKIFRTVGLDFIEKAMKFVSQRTENPTFFIFTDDKEWGASVITEILTFYPQVVLVKDSDVDDILLMSICKHNIICNSTYSWWAAFLNKNAEKIIVSPKYWTYDDIWNAKILDSLLPNIVLIDNE